MGTTSFENSLNVKQVIMIATVAIIVAIGGYFLLANAWDTVTTIVAVHSMLAFLTITCSGFILVQYRVREQSEQTVFHAALFYAALVNVGRVVRITFDNNLITEYGELSLLATDLVYLGVFSILIFLGVLMKKLNMIKKREFSVAFLIVTGLFIHLSIVYIIIPTSPQYLIQLIGITFGLCTSTILPISGLYWVITNPEAGQFQLTYMVAGYAVFGIAWIPLTLSLFFTTNIWILAFPLMTMGLILLCMAAALPFQLRSGMRRVYAFFITVGFTILGVVPTGISIIVDTYSPIPATPNRYLFMVVHLGASLMAGIMAFLIYHYDDQVPHPKRRPIVTLFITWATVEMYQVVKAFILPEDMIAQSIMPYLIGSIFLLLHIPYAIKWTSNLPKTRRANPKRVIIVAPIMILILFVAESIQTLIHGPLIDWESQAIGRSVLLASALLGVFAFVFHISVQIKDSKGRMSVDVLTTTFLALWIIPSIIKANFTMWTVGWWASELFLLLGVLFGPAVLGYLYLVELGRAAESQKRARLFADLLVHDISNYHQALALSIGLLDMEGVEYTIKEKAIKDANVELARADQLVRNVRRIGMAEELVEARLHSVDVIPVLHESCELASRRIKKQEIKFAINCCMEECHVKANALLKDVFLNIFDNSIKYSEEVPVIHVNVEEFTQNRESYCRISITDHGKGIEPGKRGKMFERYMEDAVGTGLGLSVVRSLIQAYGGSIQIEERVSGDY
ncbi:MAG: sensor histidine kinase, partial [Candidatus Thorarchaeota archaeon]